RHAPSVRADRRADARGHVDLHVAHARQRLHGGARLRLHLILDGTGRRRELDGERDAPTVDLQILHEAETDDVPVEVGVLDDLERIEDRRFIDAGAGGEPRHTLPAYTGRLQTRDYRLQARLNRPQRCRTLKSQSLKPPGARGLEPGA